MRFLLLLGIFFVSLIAKGHIIDACSIFTDQYEIVKTYPGLQCLFFKDGSFVSADGSFIQYVSNVGDVVWKREIENHHSLNLSVDQKRILVITSDRSEEVGHCPVRADAFEVLQLQNGRTLSRFSFIKDWRNYQDQFPKSPIWLVNNKSLRRHNCEYEITHFNSFFEVPSNEMSKANSAFSAGNYIVNSHNTSYLILLDRNLKEVVWKMNTRKLGLQGAHDVQVLPNGKILFYKESDELNLISPVLTLNEIDLVQQKRTILFPNLNDQFVIRFGLPWLISDLGILNSGDYLEEARYGGSVRFVEDGILTTQNIPGVGGHIILIGKDGKIAWKKPNYLKNENGRPANFSYVRKENLTEFLNRSKVN